MIHGGIGPRCFTKNFYNLIVNLPRTGYSLDSVSSERALHSQLQSVSKNHRRLLETHCNLLTMIISGGDQKVISDFPSSSSWHFFHCFRHYRLNITESKSVMKSHSSFLFYFVIESHSNVDHMFFMHHCCHQAFYCFSSTLVIM